MKSLALALLLACVAPSVALADEPALETLMTRLDALGPAREGEADVYAQLERALTWAERAEAQDETASAARHRALVDALMRGIESSRQAALARTQLSARRQALADAQARLETARTRQTRAASDQAPNEGGTP